MVWLLQNMHAKVTSAVFVYLCYCKFDVHNAYLSDRKKIINSALIFCVKNGAPQQIDSQNKLQSTFSNGVSDSGVYTETLISILT